MSIWMDSTTLILSPKHSETDLSAVTNSEAVIGDDAVQSGSAVIIDDEEVVVKALNAINREHRDCMF